MVKKTVFFVEKFKNLDGDPHTVAFGMAIGVFVAMTPTIPFHTILAILLAFFFKASKPAAILGVFISNPFTMVFLYFACYKIGYFFFEDSFQALESFKRLIGYLESDIELSQKILYFTEFVRIKTRTFMIMNVGGIVLGVPSAMGAYYLTYNFIKKLRKKNLNSEKAVT